MKADNLWNCGGESWRLHPRFGYVMLAYPVRREGTVSTESATLEGCFMVTRTREKQLELLVPAGDLEKLQTAIRYGADAVYLGTGAFGLRANAGNFSLEDLRRAKILAAAAGVKIYLTLNASLQPNEFGELEHLLEELRPLDLDAYIVADPGVLSQVRLVDPQRPIHISTQANTCNPATAEFWRRSGACRVNLARELTLEDIRRFSDATDMELECFVHGAM